MLSESNSCLLKREKRSESEIGTRKSLVVAAYLSSEKKKKGGYIIPAMNSYPING